ncbi:MAG: LPS export ABC transporter periplasmic protein LptC [Nevskia sp.]|nr:LPS export ABC transporter periplasmic protein LptC [Nevskia sp.]
MKWSRLIPLLLLPAMAGLFYTFQRMDNSIVETPPAPAVLPRYTLSDAELTRFDADGEPSLRGQAEAIDYFDDQSGHAHQLQLELVAGDERTWHLSSPTATLPAHQRRFMLDGPVLGDGQWPDNGEALALHTDRLWIDPDRHEIDTDAAVTVKSVSRNGSATGLRSDWAGQAIQLQHNVKMTYQAPKGPS